MKSIFDLIGIDIEKIKKTHFGLYVLINVIYISIFIITAYGLFKLISSFDNLSNNSKFLLLAILILIFSWIIVIIVEDYYFSKLSINSVIFNCSKKKEINIFNGCMLILMLFSVNNIVVNIFFYFFYNIGEIVFQKFFSEAARCVINKLEQIKTFNKTIIAKIKFYYLGIYKYILIFIRLITVLYLTFIYFLFPSIFIKSFYLLPIIIILNEIIYWTIRVNIYLSIEKQDKEQKDNKNNISKN